MKVVVIVKVPTSLFIVGKIDKIRMYRIFSIKRRGRLFRTRPRGPSVYSNPAFIRGPVHFSAICFFYYQYWKFIEL